MAYGKPWIRLHDEHTGGGGAVGGFGFTLLLRFRDLLLTGDFRFFSGPVSV